MEVCLFFYVCVCVCLHMYACACLCFSEIWVYMYSACVSLSSGLKCVYVHVLNRICTSGLCLGGWCIWVCVCVCSLLASPPQICVSASNLLVCLSEIIHGCLVHAGLEKPVYVATCVLISTTSLSLLSWGVFAFLFVCCRVYFISHLKDIRRPLSGHLSFQVQPAW